MPDKCSTSFFDKPIFWVNLFTMLLRLLTVTAMIAALIRQPEFLVPIGSQRCHQRVPQHVHHQHRDRPENLNKVFLICLSVAQKEHGEIYTLDKQPNSMSGIQ